MGSVILGVEQSDVMQGASITFTRLFETWIGSGQAAPASGVTISITAASTPGGGSGTPLTPTPAPSVDGANYSYAWLVPAATAPGDYVVTWTGTGGLNGSTVLTYEQYVTVAANPPQSITPAPGQYATVAQYQNWSGDFTTPTTIVQTKLYRASEDMDRALIAAVYATDANGRPTDALVVDVLMRATCAQVQFLLDDNDDSGVKRQYSQTNVAGVQATRTKAAQSPEMPPLGPRALSILHTNGVIPSAVLINW